MNWFATVIFAILEVALRSLRNAYSFAGNSSKTGSMLVGIGNLKTSRARPCLAVALSIVFVLCFSSLVTTPFAQAADPGHPASSVSAGTFEAGDFTFPDNLTINDFLIVNTTTLYVDAVNERVGIGTMSPTQGKVVINGTGGTGLYMFSDGDNRNEMNRVNTEKANVFRFTTDGSTDWSFGQPDANDYSGDGTDFYIGTAEDTPDFLIDSSGNVGIGTTSPEGLLHLSNNPTGAGDVALIIQNNDTTNGETASLLFRTTTSALDDGRIVTERISSGESKMHIYTNTGGTATERVTILNNGNVGINTTGPDTQLHVWGGVCVDTDDACSDPGSGNLYVQGNIESVSDINTTSGDICIYGSKCLSQTGTGDGDVTDVLAGYGITVDNSGGPSPRVNLSSSSAGAGLTYAIGVLAVGGGEGIYADTDQITFDCSEVTDAANDGMTCSDENLVVDVSPGDGLEMVSNQLALNQSCGDGQVLKWVSSGSYWNCTADSGIGSESDTLQTVTTRGDTTTDNVTIDSDSNELTNIANTLYVNGTVDKVGIGTTSPGEKLEVAGDVKIVTGTDEVWIGTEASDPIGQSLYLMSDGDNGVVRTYYYSSELLLQAGSIAGTRSYINLKDDNEGTGYIAFAPSDSEAMIIKNDGNVGIGTTDPQTKLDIHGGGSDHLLNITDGSNDVMYIDNTGQVGIGTVNPGGLLELYGGGNLLIKDDANDPGDIVFQNSTGSQMARIWTGTSSTPIISLSSGDNTADITINSIGNVGIGNTGPDTELHVQGGLCVDTDAACSDPGDGNVYVQGNIEAVSDINTTGGDICIEGGNCLSQAGTGEGDVTDVLAGYGITVDNSGGPQPRVNLSSSAAGNGLDYTNGVLTFDCSEVAETGNDGISCSTEELQVSGGNGLSATTTGLAIDLYTGSGLIADGTGLSINRSCGDGEVLKWETTGSYWHCAAGLGSESDPIWSGNYTACSSSQKLYFNGRSLACNNDADTTCSGVACTVGSDDTLTSPTVGGDLNMGNYLITNIGASGTDFVTNGGLTLASNLTVGTTDLVVDVAGDRVGIGTASPGEKLEIQKSPTEGSTFIKLSESSTATDSDIGIDWYMRTNLDNAGRIAVERQGSSAEYDMVFYGWSGGVGGSSTPYMVIDENGNVGIGNTGPDTELHVQGGLCVDTDAACSDPGDGNVYAQGNIEAAGDINTTSGDICIEGGKCLSQAGTGSGSVTSVSAGNGMDFTTITTSGSVTMGTPGTLGSSSSNEVTTTSHTHDIADDYVLNTGDTVDGDLIIDSNTDTQYLYVSRLGSTSNEYLRVGVDDGQARVYRINDESTGGITILINNTDTETGGGASANTGTIVIGSSATENGFITVDGNEVWHAGNDGSTSGLDADKLDGSELAALQEDIASTSCTYGIESINDAGVVTCASQQGTGGGWATSGTYVYNDTAGVNVGIGTASPNQKLEVAGSMIWLDGSNTYSVIDRSASNRRGVLSFVTAGDSSESIPATGLNWAVGVADSDDAGDGSEFFIGTTTTGGAAKLWIETSGNVGIGGTSPDTPLHIVDTVSNIQTIQRSGSGNAVSTRYNNTDGQLYLGMNAEEGFAVGPNLDLGSSPFIYTDSSGNVGIGDTTPTARLGALASSGPQLMLTHTDNVDYSNFTVDASGDLTITPSGGDVVIKLG